MAKLRPITLLHVSRFQKFEISFCLGPSIKDVRRRGEGGVCQKRTFADVGRGGGFGQMRTSAFLEFCENNIYKTWLENKQNC